MKNRLIFVPAGILFGAILALGVSSMAEDSELDAGPRVFPYNGVLEFNGEALNGNVDLQFTLTDEVDCIFDEAHENVAVFSGRFTTNIGSVAGDVPTCVFDADEVFIQVAVREADSEGEYTALVGQQRIHPVPFAYWAAEGSDFRIDGAATIGGLATLNGGANINGALALTGNISDSNSDVTVSDGLIVTGNATIRGSIQDNTGDVTINDNLDITGNIQDTNGDVIIEDGLDINGTLQITGNISDTNSDVTVSDGLIVTGNATIRGSIQDNTGDVTINDNLDITGNIQDTNGDVVINDGLDVSGNLDLGMRLVSCTPNNSSHFDCNCASGEFVLSGGGHGNNGDEILRESRPVLQGGIWGWRVACADSTGSDSGNSRTCNSAYALCGRLEVSGTTGD